LSENKKKEKFLRENKTLKERKEEIEGSRPRFFREGFLNYVGDVRGEKGGPDLLYQRSKACTVGGERKETPHTPSPPPSSPERYLTKRGV